MFSFVSILWNLHFIPHTPAHSSLIPSTDTLSLKKVVTQTLYVPMGWKLSILILTAWLEILSLMCPFQYLILLNLLRTETREARRHLAPFPALPLVSVEIFLTQFVPHSFRLIQVSSWTCSMLWEWNVVGHSRDLRALDVWISNRRPMWTAEHQNDMTWSKLVKATHRFYRFSVTPKYTACGNTLWSFCPVHTPQNLALNHKNVCQILSNILFILAFTFALQNPSISMSLATTRSTHNSGFDVTGEVLFLRAKRVPSFPWIFEFRNVLLIYTI